MKKLVKILFLLFAFLVPTTLLFAGCSGGELDNDDMLSFVVTPKSNVFQINEHNEINLEHGQVYNIDVNSFNYYESYANGKKVITDTSKITFNTSFPSGTVAPLGNYEISFSYGDYSNSFTIKINKTVAKPVASQTSFTYNGDCQVPEITGVQDEYMYQIGESSGVDASPDYFKMFSLRENCMWNDGTTEPYTVYWAILPYEIPTPTYNTITYDPYDAGRNPAECLKNASDYEGVPNFSLEQYDNIVDFGEDINSAGTHTVYCEIKSPNYCFADGEKRVAGEFVINALYIDIPDFVKEYTYSNGGHSVQFVDGWPLHVTAISDDYYQTQIGTHYSTFEVSDPGNVLWAGIEDFEDGESINDYVIKVNNSQIKLKWKIVPIKIERPILVEKEVLFDYNWHAPIDYKSSEGMEILYNGYSYGDTAEYDAGKYTVDISLEYGYAWKDTGTTETVHYDWEILKRNLSAPESGTNYEEWKNPYYVYAKNTFNINDIFLSFEFDFSTFSTDEEMPIYTGEPIAWENIAEGSYKFVDSNGIIWLKKITGDKTTISQSFDLSEKRIGDTQVAYATYYSPNKNFFDKKDIAFNIEIAEKGSQWIDFEWDDPFVPNITHTYGDVFMFEQDNLSIRSGADYKIKYLFKVMSGNGSNFEYYQGDTSKWADVGQYEVWIALEENENYEYYTKYVRNDFNFGKKILTAENLVELSASKINWLDTLEDSLFVGNVMHNGRAVEGTFSWENPNYEPTLDDSNVTSFNYTFTPTSANYTAYQSAITLIVDRAIVTAETFPDIGRAPHGYGSDFFFEGDNWTDMVLNQANACVRDKKNSIIDGTWEIVIPEGKTIVDDDFALKFIPNNQTYYQDCLFENLYGELTSYYKIKDIGYNTGKEPEFIINFDGKHYYHVQKAAVTYTNITAELNYEYDFEKFSINKKDDETYTLSFNGYTSLKTFDYSNFVEVTTEYDLLNYVLYHDHVSLDSSTILVVNADMDIDRSTLGTSSACLDICRMLIPEGRTVNFKSSVYLHKDSDLAGEDIFAEDAVIHDLSHTFYNFGTLSFNDVSGNMELRNYGTTTITYYVLDYLSMYNAKNSSVNVISCMDIGQEIKYRSFGSFENHGTFNYIYHLKPAGDALKDSVNEDELYRFKISKDSINTGTLTGLFEIATADLFLNSGSSLKPMTEIYYKNAGGTRVYELIRTIVRDETVEPSDMGALEVRAETAEDLALGFKLNYYLERSERVAIRVMKDIDISQSDLFCSYGMHGNTDKATLILNENCKMYIESYITLNLGDYVLGLHCNNFGEEKAKLWNYGTVIGNVVCEVDKYPSNTEIFFQSNYISGSGDIDGKVWAEEEYLAWLKS